MKRIIALLLSLTLFLSGCAQSKSAPQSQAVFSESTAAAVPDSASETYTPRMTVWKDDVPQYSSLNDTELLGHIEDLVYRDTVASLNSADYLVSDVSAVYVSKEYLEELNYNSQSNIYFGYTLDELDAQFQGKRYVFTLGDDGKTTVQALQTVVDDSTETMLKNVAIGSGVILISVTVSTATAGAAPAVSMILAVSAKTGAIGALSGGAMGAIPAGIVKGIQTGNMEEALKAAALAGSEGFKWGAISGALTGGAKEAAALKSMTKGGLTMNQAASIQQATHWPADVISEFHSVDEYKVYEKAGLKPAMVNGKTALVQDIDLNFKSTLPDGTEVTNLERMQHGYAPLDPATEKAYQLHHVGQKSDGTLAILKEAEHQGNSSILNFAGKESEIDRDAFNKTRKEFWQYLGNVVFA
ncbi:HNH/ENDO VII family nuclease [Faecalibacterium prausnitzii]|uniref:HNH/ENDO VII family nuclease n=1 Tax=Faecalibacterium prausnitzii TaxID=853 RepID=UPI0022E8C199|nr:HNH/ENDO VII family nuclease [Faecalibacterium prausnitzii]